MGRLKHIPEKIEDRIPKVYFSCHKDDFEPFFKEISAEILKDRKCAVFYDEDIDGTRDENFYFDLSQMNLFVMPITTKLLTTPNRANDEELAFAIEHKIPVLPLMQESGLEELYSKKFGDLQFLDKNSKDTTAISYEEKLNKYLSSVLLNDEIIKRIRAEFDAYIFLSYRKKDRIHANRLMRLIHKNDFCRDIAIWYDEFLTPGENFNENIKKALDKSGLFVLAVTPSLLEPRIDENGNKFKNYIEEHEYPMACNAQKPILPTELVATDKGVLAVKYANIPDCVNADDENTLCDALSAQLKDIAKPENDNNPEHSYLIGLAYLDGIDVEVDHEKARELIEYAANADNLDAIDKLIKMYSTGRGVERNYETAVKWRLKYVLICEQKANATNDENDIIKYIDAIYEYILLNDQNDFSYEKGYWCERLLSASELLVSINNSKENQRCLMAAHDKLYGYFSHIGDKEKATMHLERARALFGKQLGKFDPDAEKNLADQYVLSILMGGFEPEESADCDLEYDDDGQMLPLTVAEEMRLTTAKAKFEKYNGISDQRDLAETYYVLSYEKGYRNDNDMLKYCCNKAIFIQEEIVEKLYTYRDRITLSGYYLRMWGLNLESDDVERADEYLQKAIEISEKAAFEKDDLSHYEELFGFYQRVIKGLICVDCNEYENRVKKEVLPKSLVVCESIIGQIGVVEAYNRNIDAPACYYDMASYVYFTEKKNEDALEYYIKAAEAMEVVTNANKTAGNLCRLVEYLNMATYICECISHDSAKDDSEKLKNTVLAQQYLAKAINAKEEAVRLKENSVSKAELCKDYVKLAQLFLENEDIQGAIFNYRMAAIHYESIAFLEKDASMFGFGAKLYRELGKAYLLLLNNETSKKNRKEIKKQVLSAFEDAISELEVYASKSEPLEKEAKIQYVQDKAIMLYESCSVICGIKRRKALQECLNLLRSVEGADKTVIQQIIHDSYKRLFEAELNHWFGLFKKKF